MVVDNEITCKYCGRGGVVKFGTHKGKQLYWCKACRRKFRANKNLFGMRTPTKQIATALNCYYEGMSIKAIRRHLQQEYGDTPSTATIYEWIMRYTQYAIDSAEGYKPKVGDTWIADETMIEVDGKNLWLFDIIDDETRYLLATRLTSSKTTQDAQMLIDRATKKAGKNPKVIITDKLASYLDVNYGKDTEHRQGGIARIENNTQKIERFHGTLKQRTKVMRGLKNIESAHDFVQGWLVHYNYLRPHDALNDKTPAGVAGIDYPYNNWFDVISKHEPEGEIIIEHQPRVPSKKHIRIVPKQYRRRHREVCPQMSRIR